MHRTLVMVLLSGCTLALGACGVTEDRFRPISLAEVRRIAVDRRPSDVLIVDARLLEPFEVGHIPGARRLDLVDATAKTSDSTINPELDVYKTIVVYGENPASPSARALTARLMEHGHRDVRIFWDGFAAWKRSGLAIEAPPR